MADEPIMPEHLKHLNNVDGVFRSLYNAVVKLHREEDYARSDHTLEKRLLNPGLPIILQARCHVFLATCDTDLYLHPHRNFECLPTRNPQVTRWATLKRQSRFLKSQSRTASSTRRGSARS